MDKVKLTGVKRNHQQIEDTKQFERQKSQREKACVGQNTPDVKRMPVLRLMQETTKRVRTETSSNSSMKMTHDNFHQISDRNDPNRNASTVTQHTPDRAIWVVTTQPSSSRTQGPDSTGQLTQQT